MNVLSKERLRQALDPLHRYSLQRLKNDNVPLYCWQLRPWQLSGPRQTPPQQGRAAQRAHGTCYASSSYMDSQVRELDAGAVALFEVLREAVIVTDAKGSVVYWNVAAERMFGYPRKYMIGQNLALIMPTEHHCAFARGVERYNRTGVPKMAGTTFGLNAKRRDGEEFPVEIALARWFIEGDAYFCGILQDLRNTKLLPHPEPWTGQFSGQLAQLARVYSMQSRKTLSPPLQDFLHSLPPAPNEPNDPAAQKAQLKEQWTAVRRGAEDILALLHNLEIADGAADGNLDGHLTMDEAVTHAMELLGDQIQATQARVHASKLPALCYNGEAMRQVWVQILNHALQKPHHERTPIITICATVLDGYCNIRCHDNGNGHAQSQSPSPTGEAPSGSNPALATSPLHELALVRYVCESMGGAMNVENLPGEGTTINMLLPEFQDCSLCHAAGCRQRLH